MILSIIGKIKFLNLNEKKIMKNFILLFSLIVIQNFFTNTCYSQTNYNATIEYCAGTWNQWDPCGHVIIDQILQDYPNTVALAYHGAGNDPWQSYSSGIRTLFGFSAYPTGVVGRKSGIIDRAAWYNSVAIQTQSIQPGVSIHILNKNYDNSTRTLSAAIDITALLNLSGNYYISYILTENNLTYSQTGNTSCTGGANYLHNHVVKSMLNGDLGELIHSGNWTSGTNVLRNINFIIPDLPQVSNVSNCELNILVYKQQTSISTNYDVQQSIKTSVVGTTYSGIRLYLKLLYEGLYSSTFNQMSRKDSVIVYLRESTVPFSKLDSSASRIDSLTFNGLFQLLNAPTGNYYIVTNHFNSLETWSKAGGEYLIRDGALSEYDFTSSGSQAYGNNLKLKGSKYCIYSGDINQDGFVDLADIVPIKNDATNFVSGNHLVTDLNGDGNVDLTDLTICYNNSTNFIRIRRP